MSITPRVCREDTDLIRSWSGSHQHLPGERCRRIVTRRGKLKALVAVARSILVILWQLLSHPGARYHDLGADYYTTRTDTEPESTSASSRPSTTRSPSAPRDPTPHRFNQTVETHVAAVTSTCRPVT